MTTAQGLLIRRELTREISFTIAIAILCGLLVGVLSASAGAALTNTDSLNHGYEEVQAPDAVLKYGPGSLDDADVSELASLPEVERTSRSSALEGVVGAHDAEVPLALTPDSSQQTVTVGSGEPPRDMNEIALPRVLAESIDVEVGDSVEFTANSTTSRLRVTGLLDDPVFGSPLIAFSRAVVSEESLKEIQALSNVPEARLSALIEFWTSDGAANDAIEAFSGTFRADFAYDKEFLRTAYTMVPSIISVLLFITTAILTTVLALVLRQTTTIIVQRDWRQSGLLKALGFSSRQVRARLVARVTLIATLGSAIGAMGGLIAVPLLAEAYLRSNGLSLSSTPVWWPVGAITILVIAIVWALTSAASRPLTRSRPRDAILTGALPRKTRGLPLGRTLSWQMPTLALALNDVRRFPGRYVTLAFAMALLSILTLSLAALSSSFSTPQRVATALGLNTFDVALTRTSLDENSETWHDALLSETEASHAVEFTSSWEERNLRTDSGVVVATVVGSFPDSFTPTAGRLPDENDEVVLARGLAERLDVGPGDQLELGGPEHHLESFTIAGIAETASQTGLTLWLENAAYQRIDPEFIPNTYVWNLRDIEDNDVEELVSNLNDRSGTFAVDGRASTEALTATVQTAVTAILLTVSISAAIITLIVSALLAFTALASEARDLAVREALGSRRAALRRQLALRTGVTTFIGAVGGGLLALIVTPLGAGTLLRGAGLSSVDLEVPIWLIAVTVVALTTLSFGSTALASMRMRPLNPRTLTEE